MQIGWATKYCRFDAEEGVGVGDDNNSFAYDGYRRRLWSGGVSIPYGDDIEWKQGDVLGCFVNLGNETDSNEENLKEEEKGIVFYVNGKNFGLGFKFSQSDIGQIKDASGLFPVSYIENKWHCFFYFLIISFLYSFFFLPLYQAASFMGFQQASFNFGQSPFLYPPHGEYRSISSLPPPSNVASLREKLIPRLASGASPRSENIKNLPVMMDGICDICMDRSSNIILRPCGHKGICFQCSLEVEKCPVCRELISVREEIVYK